MSETLEDLTSEPHAKHNGRSPRGTSTSRRNRPPTLSIVIPTKNEAGNIAPLIDALSSEFGDTNVEVIFVDDSDDDTARHVERVANETEPLLSVRLVERLGEQRAGGLSGAVLDGIAAATSRWVCVMDGDLQHPPSVIKQMVAMADLGEADLVCASRYCLAGSNEGLNGHTRKLVSSMCGHTAQWAFPERLGTFTDPMSGFFLVDRERLDLGRVEPRGFKVLLELVISHPELRLAEVPFSFGERHSGTSKASFRQGIDFARQMLALKRRSRRASTSTWKYDVHGILTLESERALPELEKFLVRALPGPASITVRIADHDTPPGESLDLTGAAPVVRYRERAGFAMSMTVAPGQTEITVSPFVARSPHVMYTNVVEPVLRWRLAELGHALVHAACFSDGERGFLVTARTDTGKTTTMLKVLDNSTFQFVTDDLVIVDADGAIRSFPKPLTISAHTVHALHDTMLTRLQRIALVPQSRIHSREGRRLAFLLTRFRLPVASINALIQLIVPPPKYHVGRLVRGVESARTAQLAGMFVIQRGGTGEEELAPLEALEILLSNCDDAFGFPPYSSLERMLLAVADDDLRRVEREIVASALEGAPTRLMRSDTLDWATRIPAVVEDWVEHESPELATAR